MAGTYFLAGHHQIEVNPYGGFFWPGKGGNLHLRDEGVYVDTKGLAWPQEAKIVRAGANAEVITDSVFPESKEFLAGYWIIDVESPEQAYKIAARASAAPGPGGKPGNMPIEVRQVLSSHSDLGL